MNRFWISAFAASLLLFGGMRPAVCGEISRAFEFRYVTGDPKADGETDFKGETSIFSTEDRIAFLKHYAEYASAYFNDPGLDREVASFADATDALRRLKPQPSPAVRKRIPLDNWKWTGFREGKREEEARAISTWEGSPGIAIEDGALVFAPEKAGIRHAFPPQSWRFTLAWTARPARNDRRISFSLACGDTMALTVGFAENGALFHTEGSRETQTVESASGRATKTSLKYLPGALYRFTLEVGHGGGAVQPYGERQPSRRFRAPRPYGCANRHIRHRGNGRPRARRHPGNGIHSDWGRTSPLCHRDLPRRGLFHRAGHPGLVCRGIQRRRLE